ncbi:hypothetical protein GGI15_002138 [Coemansia interrupta]|uniref:Amine oxidase domain-containing protein n=1 Tax=Coemansia interrupta TaxID=1126814 RepID=A0A9W8HM80_9FUNG|nr:hypothetical protein GGI15_002138 [Coemansia interrupta]
MDTEQPAKSVAVIGSGLAGLTAAHFLQRGGRRVTLFEQGAAVGMDAASLTVGGARIDVPLRVFTPAYYPCLTRMYAHLGVASSAADYSLCVSHAGEPVWSYTNVHVLGVSVPVPDGLWAATGAGARRRRVTRDWVRLLYAALQMLRMPWRLADRRVAQLTIAQYLAAQRYSPDFAEHVLVPFVAAVMTCSLRAAAEYPANAVLDFVGRVAFGAGVQRAAGGVQEVCRALAEDLRDVRLGTAVVAVEPGSDDGGCCHVVVEAADGSTQRMAFDAVVLATQADVAARLLSAARSDGLLDDMLRALRAVPYEDARDARVYTHTDASVMPADRAHWHAVNLATHATGCRVTSTHWLSRVDGAAAGSCGSGHVFQTVDPADHRQLRGVVGATHFRRALVTVESQALLDTLHAAQGRRGVWVAGTYAAPGLPLLEGCVRSALDVVRALRPGPLPFAVPPLLSHAGAPGAAEVGLAAGMRRGGVVAAHYACCGAAVAAGRAPEPARLAAAVRKRRPRAVLAWAAAAARWALWTLGLPALALLLAVADLVLCSVLGTHVAARLQDAALDALVGLAAAAVAVLGVATAAPSRVRAFLG